MATRNLLFYRLAKRYFSKQTFFYGFYHKKVKVVFQGVKYLEVLKF